MFFAAFRAVVSAPVVFVTEAVIMEPEASVGVATFPPATVVVVEGEVELLIVPVDTTANVYFLPCVNPVTVVETIVEEVIVTVLVVPPLDDVAVTI